MQIWNAWWVVYENHLSSKENWFWGSFVWLQGPWHVPKSPYFFECKTWILLKCLWEKGFSSQFHTSWWEVLRKCKIPGGGLTMAHMAMRESSRTDGLEEESLMRLHRRWVFSEREVRFSSSDPGVSMLVKIWLRYMVWIWIVLGWE